MDPDDQHLDVWTLREILHTADEPDIGRAIKEQLAQRCPAITDVDVALLGEAAVESVVFPYLYRAQDEARSDPST